jgi:hypothetical protein
LGHTGISEIYNLLMTLSRARSSTSMTMLPVVGSSIVVLLSRAERRVMLASSHDPGSALRSAPQRVELLPPGAE